MRVLGIDTAGSSCSVAVIDRGIATVRHRPMQRGHAEALVPMVQEVLATADLTFAALDLLAVSVGPGSFTGLRVGLASARAMALAAARPCLGITAFEAWAGSLPEGTEANVRATPLLVALDSRRADLFVQVMGRVETPLAVPAALAPEALAGHLPPGAVMVTGDAATTAVTALVAAGRTVVRAPDPARPLGHAVALRAQAMWQEGMRAEVPPAPFYLRAPDVSPPVGPEAAR